VYFRWEHPLHVYVAKGFSLQLSGIYHVNQMTAEGNDAPSFCERFARHVLHKRPPPSMAGPSMNRFEHCIERKLLQRLTIFDYALPPPNQVLFNQRIPAGAHKIALRLQLALLNLHEYGPGPLLAGEQDLHTGNDLDLDPVSINLDKVRRADYALRDHGVHCHARF